MIRTYGVALSPHARAALMALALAACDREPTTAGVAAPAAPSPSPSASPLKQPGGEVIEDFPAASVTLERIKLRSIAAGAGAGTATAIIELPDGTRHEIKVGSMIGRSLGQVKEIRADAVIVEEQKRDVEGRRHSYDVVLRVTAP